MPFCEKLNFILVILEDPGICQIMVIYIFARQAGWLWQTKSLQAAGLDDNLY